MGTSGSYAVRAQDLAALRSERSDGVDRRLAAVYADALAQVPGAAGCTSLVAVGGFGRREMSPYSDVDVVLLHDPDVDPGVVERLAGALWYPLWDDGVPLDHAVRDVATMRSVARRDWRAALGMLDARHVVGAASLSQELRSRLLADWRADARHQLPDVRAAGRARAERAGDLAHAAVPDLKESYGGLRDAVVLRALVATWLVDVPHQQLEEYRSALLDVRDAVHMAAGRRGNRLHPEQAAAVAAVFGSDPATLSRRVRALGRRTAHLCELTWRRLGQALDPPARAAGRRASGGPALERIEAGIARAGGEVVLDRPGAGAGEPDDPYLSLSVAAHAAERGLLVSSSTAALLASIAPAVLPTPWPERARQSFVRLLAAGPALVPVWEELDQAGLVVRWLPEWGGVRLRPSDPGVHRFTVDRHCVETCVEASRRLRDVARPDLLVVGALLHDIGKALVGPPEDGADHSAAGAPVAAQLALRMGFAPADADTVGFLVRHHLLLPSTAVRRDLEDPDTVLAVADTVADSERLGLLATLTECDARSAGPAAWTSWRAGLVRRLVAAATSVLATRGGTAPAGPPGLEPGARPVPAWASGVLPGAYRMRLEPLTDGTRVWVAAVDRLGLLADVAGALAVSGLTVQAARAVTYRPAPGAADQDVGVSWWHVGGSRGAVDVDLARLRLRLDRVLDGSTDLAARLRGSVPDPDPDPGARADASSAATRSDRGPRVRVLADVSDTATVLEVRATDRTGLVWRICRVLADAEVDVRSAHLDTLGPQCQDVFYVTDAAGRVLSGERAERVCATLAAALER